MSVFGMIKRLGLTCFVSEKIVAQKSKRKSAVTGSTLAHMAAQGGDIDALKREVSTKKDVVNAKDQNGWTVS